ncbi:unnamed protein product [Rhodiola kirilowii]
METELSRAATTRVCARSQTTAVQLQAEASDSVTRIAEIQGIHGRKTIFLDCDYGNKRDQLSPERSTCLNANVQEGKI